MRWKMTSELLPVLVPAGSELLLLAMCLMVWTRVRRLGASGIGQWTLVVIVVDGCGQVWHLMEHLGRPAGVTWLIHVSLSYLMVYVLYRLGECLRRVKMNCPPLSGVGQRSTE